MSGLLKCPQCGWWGTCGELDIETRGLFEGIGSCPDCDLLEGLLEPYEPESTEP